MGSPRGDELRSYAKAQSAAQGQVTALARRVRPLGKDATSVQRTFSWQGPFEREMSVRIGRDARLLDVAAEQLSHAARQLGAAADRSRSAAVAADAQAAAAALLDKLNPFD